MIDENAIRSRYEAMRPGLGERERRLLAAAEARSAGYGGVSAVARATGIARSTIDRGLKDLESLDPVQPRFAVPAVAADRSSRPIRPFWRTCNACSSRRRLAIRCVR
jgi:hypothetical protein